MLSGLILCTALHPSFLHLTMLLQPIRHTLEQNGTLQRVHCILWNLGSKTSPVPDGFPFSSGVTELTGAVCRGAASSIKGGVWTRPTESLTGSIKGGIWSRPSASVGSFGGGGSTAALHHAVKSHSSGVLQKGSKPDGPIETDGYDSNNSDSSKRIGNAPKALGTK
jgi:hypothetical protein